MPEPGAKEQDVEAKAAKILGDLLALSLAENDPQADAALGAIRRRAARDAITGGAVKELIERLARHAADPVDARYFAWTVDEQKREMEAMRSAHRQADAAHHSVQQTNALLAERIGLLGRARRLAWTLGFALGFGSAAALAAAAYMLLLPHAAEQPQANAAPAGQPAQHELVEQLRSCFLSSSDSLGGGTSVPLHLQLRVSPAGGIAETRLAPGQDAALADPDHKLYSEMVMRSLAPGHCGTLDVPASLRGAGTPLDVFLPG